MAVAVLSLLNLTMAYQDSNLDKQNQKLLCYRYTINQSTTKTACAAFNCGAKVRLSFELCKFFFVFFKFFYSGTKILKPNAHKIRV